MRLTPNMLYVLHYALEDKVLYKDSADAEFLMRDYQAVNNKNYNRDLGTKVRAATKTKAEGGDFPGRWTPMGFVQKKRLDKRGFEKRQSSYVDVDPNIKAVEQVQREFELRATVFFDDPKRVMSLAKIRETIIVEGFIPADKIKKYHTDTIHRRLKNKFYDRRFDWKGVEYPGNQPLIIPKKIFWRVQETFGLKNPYQKKSAGAFGGGWLKCASCGCHVVYDPKDNFLKNGKHVFYHHYHCTNGKKMHASSAGMRVHEKMIWEQFGEAVKLISIDERFAAEILDSVNESHHKSQSSVKCEIQEFATALESLEREEDRIYCDYRKGVLDEAGHNRQVQKVREQRRELSKQLERADLMITDAGMATVKSTLELAINANLKDFEKWRTRVDDFRTECFQISTRQPLNL